MSLLCRPVKAGAFGAAVCSVSFVFTVSASDSSLVTDIAPLVPEVEVSVDFCSRQLSYGLADNREPVVTPAVSLLWLDWINFNAAFICDMTDWGDRSHVNGPGYGNRTCRYQELDVGIGLVHDFSPDDFSFLPTTVSLGAGYLYEYHPRYAKCKSGGVNGNPDTQFMNLEVGLTDLWIEPVFAAEFDFDRDHGTYLNLALGHTFCLVGSGVEGGDDVLGLNLSVGQGLGDSDRNDSYLGINQWGLMDTAVTLTLMWRPLSWLAVAPYVGVTEYLFDRRLRDAARDYSYGGEPRTDSYNFIGGISVTASF